MPFLFAFFSSGFFCALFAATGVDGGLAGVVETVGFTTIGVVAGFGVVFIAKVVVVVAPLMVTATWIFGCAIVAFVTEGA